VFLAGLRSTRGLLRSLLLYYGGRERRRAMVHLYRRLVGTGDLVFDVGSHVGDRIAACRTLGAAVVAVEPQPAFVRTLQLLYGRDPGVTIVRAALGAEAGTVELFVNLDNPTVSTASPAFIAAARGAAGWEGQVWDRRLPIAQTTVDALIQRHGVPAFVKIDVEGFEAQVLGGLSHPVRALSFEFTTIQRGVAHDCLQACASLGDYRFNAALGESQRLVHDVWLRPAEIGAWLDSLPHEANSGDIYALRVG
jgi:FkbM family methyltransferase